MSSNMSKKHYIKQWREFRGYSLRKLAARMEESPGEELLSFASIGRIENGKQPYTQQTLEALAFALDCKPYMLLTMNPLVDGEVIDIMKLLEGDSGGKALNVLKAALA